MKKNEYKCAICGGVFEKGWDDEEALAELNDNFPNVEIEDCDVVCDDCYKKMTQELPIEEFYKNNKGE